MQSSDLCEPAILAAKEGHGQKLVDTTIERKE